MLTPPNGWVFFSADFSCLASGRWDHGSVMLARDRDQTKKWHQLSEEDREATQLYATGRGATIEAAFAAACEDAEASCLLP